MSMLSQHLIDTCQKVTTIRNKYGDYVESSSESISCMWRDNTILRRTSNQEIRDSDAMVWFAPSEDISRGTVLRREGLDYQVEEIVKAKKLLRGSTAVEFLKCEVKIIGIS